MQGFTPGWRLSRPALLMACLLLPVALLPVRRAGAGDPPPASTTNALDAVVILEIAGTAEVLPAGEAAWSAATAGRGLRLGDRFRTLARSRATLRLSDRSQLRMGESSELQVREAPSGSPLYRLWRGVIYFFHRDQPGRFEFETPGASAAVRGTEFVLEADAEGEGNGRTRLFLLDGRVVLSTLLGSIEAHSGQQVEAAPGEAPSATALHEASRRKSIQWCLYYPAVLDPTDLGWAREGQVPDLLRPSLAAYRAGDPMDALRAFPPGNAASSPAAELFHAALLLAVGRADLSQEILAQWDPGAPIGSPRRPGLHVARSLQALIALVKGDALALTQWEPPGRGEAATATEWLTDSYVRQARFDLAGALSSARHAADLSGDFGFAWTRVAELEFGFGETRLALASLSRAQALSPRHAGAVALGGFLRAARGEVRAAERDFERAIALDGGLGNGWLGRGLCRVRQGEIVGGLMDLQTAAVVAVQ